MGIELTTPAPKECGLTTMLSICRYIEHRTTFMGTTACNWRTSHIMLMKKIIRDASVYAINHICVIIRQIKYL